MVSKLGSLIKEWQYDILRKESSDVASTVGVGYLSFLPLSEVQLLIVLDKTSFARWHQMRLILIIFSLF